MMYKKAKTCMEKCCKSLNEHAMKNRKWYLNKELESYASHENCHI